MGQGIGFTEKAVQHPYPTHMTDDLREEMVASESIFFYSSWMREHPWSYPGVDLAMMVDGNGFFDSQFSYGPVGQVATTYGAWATFQEELSRFFIGASPHEVIEAPDEFNGRAPFFHLVAQHESEGIICPLAVRILASDFRYVASTKGVNGTLESEFLREMREEGKNHFADIYTELRDGTYYTARVGGLIDFS